MKTCFYSDLMLISTNSQRPAGHVFLAGGTIGLLAMVLSVGLSLIGIIDRVNAWISDVITHGNASALVNSLPLWTQWLAVMVVAFAIPWVILAVPGILRRLVLWISIVAVISFWIPVLGIAAYSPVVTAPLIAALWSGLCAMVYARNHEMPCEINQMKSADETR